ALVLLALADAAHLEIAGARAAGRPMQIGHECNHILDMLTPGGAGHFGTDDGHALMHIGQRLLAHSRRHEDHIDLICAVGERKHRRSDERSSTQTNTKHGQISFAEDPVTSEAKAVESKRERARTTCSLRRY